MNIPHTGMELTEKQKRFLSLLPEGEDVEIATSEYSGDPIPSTGWNPRARFTHRGLKSLERKGLIEASFFWRGARVKLLAAGRGPVTATAVTVSE